MELFSSDLQRTKQTAEAIAERLGVQPTLDRLLREKAFGEVKRHVNREPKNEEAEF